MKDLTLFLLITFLFDVSAQATRPLISLQMAAFGSTPWQIGLLFSSAQVIPMLLGIPLGRMADRIGPVRVVGFGSVAACLSYLGMALAPSSLAIAAAQSLMWIGISSVAVAQQVMIAGVGAPSERDRNYGLLGAVHASGQLAGPAVGGILAGLAGTPVVFFSSALLCFVPLLALRQLARLQAAAARPVATLPAGVRSWFGGLRLIYAPELRQIFLVSFLAMLAFDVRMSFLPVYLESLGFGKATIGLLFSALAATGILIRPFLGWLTLRLGSWRVLALAAAVVAPALVLLPGATNLAAVALGLGVFGVGYGLTQPLTMSITAGAASPAERGLALGIRFSAQMLSMLMSPLLLGAVAASLGLGAALQGAGGFALLASGAAVLGMRSAAAPARQTSAAFAAQRTEASPAIGRAGSRR